MSRLRPPANDSYGLASRDDTRLLNPVNVTSFWNTTKAKVDYFLAEDSEIDVLTRDITNLSLSTKFKGSDSLDTSTASLLSDLRRFQLHSD